MNTLNWSGGLFTFFDSVLHGDSLRQGHDAANVELRSRNPDESFVISSGDTSMRR